MGVRLTVLSVMLLAAAVRLLLLCIPPQSIVSPIPQNNAAPKATARNSYSTGPGMVIVPPQAAQGLAWPSN